MNNILKDKKNNGVELANIFRKKISNLNHLNKYQKKIINDIISCRTEALGGHVSECDHCKHEEIFYNSCRNRHCPKCGALSRVKWITNRLTEIIPVQYFHVVFTIPHCLNNLVIYNRRTMYNLLFKASSLTLKTIAESKLRAKLGFISVLHSWDQQINLHPHIHCIVTGGGFSFDKSKWIKSKKKFFVHVKILSKVFRGKFMFFLKKCIKIKG